MINKIDKVFAGIGATADAACIFYQALMKNSISKDVATALTQTYVTNLMEATQRIHDARKKEAEKAEGEEHG